VVVSLLLAVGVDHAVEDADVLPWNDVAETAGIIILFLALVGRFFVVLREATRQTETAKKAKDELAVQQARERAYRDRFLTQIVAAREDEARRVAVLLHDDAVQQLTAHMLRLEILERRAGLPELGLLAAEAREVTRSLRRLMTELHPTMLESQGLAAAIEAVAEPLREQGIKVVIDPLGLRPPVELERVAYRVIHEALVNVLKHAKATQVLVSIELTKDTLHCEVRDDGRGFDTSDVESGLSRGSFGLNLLRERIDLAGGRLRLESGHGNGTSIAFDLPLPERSASGCDAAVAGAALPP
jgi:signal transduction histidine kinase